MNYIYLCIITLFSAAHCDGAIICNWENKFSWALANRDFDRVEQLINSEDAVPNKLCNVCRKSHINTESWTELFWSIWKGDIEILKRILNGANKSVFEVLLAKNVKSRNILEWAAFSGKLEVLKFLVEDIGLDINEKDQYGITLLHSAADKGYLEVIKFLVQECKMDVNQQDTFGRTALTWAAGSDRLEVVKYLAKQTKLKRKDDYALLSWALGNRGSLKIIKFLIQECEVNVTARSKDGSNCLHTACGFCSLEIIKFLVQECGLDPTSENYYGDIPFYKTIKRKNLDELKFLLQECKMCSRIVNKSGTTILHVAAEHGNLEIIEFLVKQSKMDVDDTALRLAAENEDREVYNFLLLNYNLGINKKEQQANMPLHKAVKNGQLDVVKILLDENENDVDIKNQDGDTPLHIATRQGDLEILKLLIEKNFEDAFVLDRIGGTPLHTAAKNGRLEIVKLLIQKYKLEVNEQDFLGKTPLHLAVKNGRLEVVRFILETCKGDSQDYKYMALQKAVKAYLKKFDDSITDIKKEKFLETIEFLIRQILLENPNAFVDIIDFKDTAYSGAAFFENSINISIFIIKLLIYRLKEYHYLLYLPNEQGDTPLKASIRQSNLIKIKSLLMCGLDPNKNEMPSHDSKRPDLIRRFESTDFYLPIHVAAEVGDVAVIELLVQKGADINRQDKQGRTPLHIALEHKRWGVMLWLLEYEAQVSLRNFYKGVEWTPFNKEGPPENENALHVLIKASINYVGQYGDRPRMSIEPCFEALLNVKDLNLDTYNYEGDTVLHVLLKTLKDSGVELEFESVKRLVAYMFVKLLEKGASLNKKDKQGITVLELMVQNASAALVNQIVTNGLLVCENLVNYRDVAGNSLLHHAAMGNNAPITTYLITQARELEREHANQCTENFVEAVNLKGQTALYMAANFRHTLAACTLINEGADINARDASGRTALAIASKNGNRLVVQELLGYEMTIINIADKNGDTALHHAACNGHLDIIKLLLDKDAIDYQVQNSKGQTVLHQAARSGSEEVFHYIAQHCQSLLDKYAVDYSGNTVLHEAVLWGRTKLISLCNEYAIDFYAQNHQEETPLAMAERMNQNPAMIWEIKRGMGIEEPQAVEYEAAQPYDKEIFTQEDIKTVHERFNKDLSLGLPDKAVFAFLEALLRHYSFEYAELFEALIKQQKKIGLKDVQTLELFYLAGQYGNVRVIRFLLKHIENLEGQAVNEQALCEALKKNPNTSVAKYLRQIYPNSVLIKIVLDKNEQTQNEVLIENEKLFVENALLPEVLDHQCEAFVCLPSNPPLILNSCQDVKKQGQKVDDEWFSADQLAEIGNYLINESGRHINFIPSINLYLPANVHGSLEEALRANLNITQPLALAVNIGLYNQQSGGVGNHWVLLAILPKINGKSNAILLDPLGNRNYEVALLGLKYRVRALYGIDNIHIYTSEHIFQQDEHNCGAWILHFLEKLIHSWTSKEDFTVDQFNLELIDGKDICDIRKRYMQIWNAVIDNTSNIEAQQEVEGFHNVMDTVKEDLHRSVAQPRKDENDQGLNLGMNEIFKSAILENNVSEVNDLIKQDADIKLIGNNDLTLIRALLSQYEPGYIDLLKRLLILQQDIHSPDEQGQTLLHLAARYGDVPAVNYLINRGMAVDALNYEGQTIVHQAVQNPNSTVLRHLMDHFTKIINSVDTSGDTPAHLAARMGTVTILRHCQGLDFTVHNHKNKTPLEVAIQASRPQEVIEAITTLMTQNQPTSNASPPLTAEEPVRVRLVCQSHTNTNQTDTLEDEEDDCVYIWKNQNPNLLDLAHNPHEDDDETFPGTILATS